MVAVDKTGDALKAYIDGLGLGTINIISMTAIQGNNGTRKVLVVVEGTV